MAASAGSPAGCPGSSCSSNASGPVERAARLPDLVDQYLGEEGLGIRSALRAEEVDIRRTPKVLERDPDIHVGGVERFLLEFVESADIDIFEAID